MEHASHCSAYLDLLFESAAHYDVSVHAFVCMTNHVHILLTPWAETSSSRMMQKLGVGVLSALHLLCTERYIEKLL